MLLPVTGVRAQTEVIFMKKIILALSVFAMVAGSAFADWTKIISTGLDFPGYRTTAELKSDTETDKKALEGFGVNWDGQFRLVNKDNGFSFMWDVDAGYTKFDKPYSSMPIDCEGFDGSLLFGIGKNFSKSQSNKFILSGVVGMDVIVGGFSKESSDIVGSYVYTTDTDWLMAEVNFLAGLDFYFSHKFDSAFGVFASCTAAVGSGSVSWRRDTTVKCDGVTKSDTSIDGKNGNTQIFVFTPKVGLCWTF